MNEHEALLSELQAHRQRIKQGGDTARIAQQHAKGKYTARERIASLVDEGTFQELDGFMSAQPDETKTGDAMITGFGKINGRLVALFAQDFTVLGGSFSEVQGEKIAKIMDLALQSGIPVIGLNDSVGARIQEGIHSLGAYAELFWRNTQASGVIPQISVMLGPCAGGSVYSPALTDFVIMTQGSSHMFITGPDVIKAVTQEEVDLETLGGTAVHTSVSGVAHFAAANEDESLSLARKLISYLPANHAEPPPAIKPTDDPWRMDTTLNSIVPIDPSMAYDMKQVITRIFDEDSFLEIHAAYAPNAIVGFARLHGQVVGIVAQQPDVLAGVIDINAADKISRFVRFCDAFNIPLVTFVDSPGFLPGLAQEHGGIIRHGAKIVYAYAEATVPKICVVTRKAYGGAYIVMSSKYIRTDLVFAWPTAEIAVMGAEGAVSVLYRKHLQRIENPQAEQMRLLDEYRKKFAKPYTPAAHGFVDDIIAPAETRPRLIAALELLHDKCVVPLPKKHGIMPV